MAKQQINPTHVRVSVEERRNRIEQEIREHYPDLRVIIQEDEVVLRGSYPIEYEGEILERYVVEIFIPPTFPYDSLRVYEIEGRIPHSPERHISFDGSLCIMVPEEWFLFPERTVLRYLDEPVRNFLIQDSLVARGMSRPFGERPHYSEGLLEAYGEMVGSRDPNVIIGYLECLSKNEMKGHWKCPCGSGLRLRNCHLENVRILRERIQPWVARSAIHRLRKS